MDERKLYDLVPMHSPEGVLDEARVILELIEPGFDDRAVTAAFSTAVRLFRGHYPGYRACSTEYHDLHHTTDTFLAMVRLIHGAVLEGCVIDGRAVTLGLIAALFHDAGYIQEEKDREGSGGKHTIRHVQRSMDFVGRHGRGHGLGAEEIGICRNMILCTDLAVRTQEIGFSSGRDRLLGKMLGAADLLAQMADRSYLEKLLFLYREFREGHVGDYESEADLLRKTVGFYDLIERRMEEQLDNVDRFMEAHFIARWDIPTDLYHESIQNQRNYLRQILKMPDADPVEHLRRSSAADTARDKDRPKE